MVNIKITKGLDIPLKGKPEGSVQALIASGQAAPMSAPAQIGLNLSAFDTIKFKLLVKPGDTVKIGDPIAEDKSTPGRLFVSPAAGSIHDIQRGLKRSLQTIVINVARQEEYREFGSLDPQKAAKETIINRLLEAGAFASIRSRPFNVLADPTKTPRSIFVKAIESAPYAPPAELQIMGHEKDFQTGIWALKALTDGPVHLIYRKGSKSSAFTAAEGVQKHTAEGPHPIGNASVHIQHIDPIRSVEDAVWTLTARDVVAIGYLLNNGRCFIDRVVGIGGSGILTGKTGYFKVRDGYPIAALISGRLEKKWMRLVSGDPLMGNKTTAEEFLGFYHTAFCAIPEHSEREFLHFMGLGIHKYTFSKAYLSGHLDNSKREYDFTTSLHGEHRAFIDSTLYDKVMPLDVPTMLLVKAIMAEDFDLAVTLGLLEVDSEDFALPTFVCPSKKEMTEIVKQGLRQYAQETFA